MFCKFNSERGVASRETPLPPLLLLPFALYIYMCLGDVENVLDRIYPETLRNIQCLLCFVTFSFSTEGL